MAELAEGSRHASVARATGVRTSYSAPKIQCLVCNDVRAKASPIQHRLGMNRANLGNGTARSGLLTCNEEYSGVRIPDSPPILRDRVRREYGSVPIGYVGYHH